MCVDGRAACWWFLTKCGLFHMIKYSKCRFFEIINSVIALAWWSWWREGECERPWGSAEINVLCVQITTWTKNFQSVRISRRFRDEIPIGLNDNEPAKLSEGGIYSTSMLNVKNDSMKSIFPRPHTLRPVIAGTAWRMCWRAIAQAEVCKVVNKTTQVSHSRFSCFGSSFSPRRLHSLSRLLFSRSTQTLVFSLLFLSINWLSAAAYAITL